MRRLLAEDVHTTQQADGDINEDQLLNFLVNSLDEGVALTLGNNVSISAEDSYEILVGACVKGTSVSRLCENSNDLAHENTILYFRLPEPDRTEAAAFGAEIARFPNTAVVLAVPTIDGWFDTRITQYSKLPYCVCFTTNQNPIDTTTWFDRTIEWLSPEPIGGQIDIVERREG